jgi:Tol biopolymer transport system component
MSRKDAAVVTFLGLLAIALGAAAVFSELTAASWPGRSGPVVYVGVREGEHRYSYETTGLKILEPGVHGSARPLTSDPSDADPQVSPDGRLVVFSREVPGDSPAPLRALFLVGIDGSGLRQLTDPARQGLNDVEPTFYPSGQSIAFVRIGSIDRGNGDLYSVRLDGSILRQLTDGPRRERDPAISPNGRQIAFTCGAGGPDSRIEDVCSIRPDGSRRRVLTRALKQGAEPFDPDFSPSGRTIAFTLGPGTAADVFTMRANGARLGALTNRSPSGRRTFPRELGYASPSFAPEGNALVAVARGAGPRLVRIPLRFPKYPQPLGAGFFGSAPVWAPG